MKKIFLLLILILLISIDLISQTIPKQINYQGILKDATGNLLTGDYALTFKIYNEPTGGTPLWTEIQVLSVNNGLFNTQLGSNTPISGVPFDRTHFLGIQVGTAAELTPRTMLTPSPYSFMSMNIMDEAVTTSKIQDGSITNIKIGSNQIVKSLNGLKDDVTLVAGTNITLTTSGSNLTINAAGGGGGTVTQVNTGAGLTGGPITTNGTISIPNDGITSAMLQSNSVTSAKITDGTIASGDLANNSVTSTKIVDATITGTDISNNTIGPEKLNFTPGTGTIGGSGTANYIPKFTANTTLGNSEIYQTSGGNIGIGTTSPTAKFQLDGGDALINTLTIGRGGVIQPAPAGNVALGYQCLMNTTVGNSNTAVGYQTMINNTEGGGNSAYGQYALRTIVTDFWNTAIGFSAGDYRYMIEAGTFVGDNAYPSTEGTVNVTALGHEARSTNNNQVRIGNTNVTSIGGYAGWSNLSDERFKVAVNENVKGLDFILKLRPVTYQLDMNKLSKALNEDQRRDEDGNIVNTPLEMDVKARNEKSQMVFTGFVAQEVEQAANEIGFDFSGIDKPKNESDFYGLRYAEFVVPLVKAIQEQQKIIEDLTLRIKKLEKK